MGNIKMGAGLDMLRESMHVPPRMSMDQATQGIFQSLVNMPTEVECVMNGGRIHTERIAHYW